MPIPALPLRRLSVYFLAVSLGLPIGFVSLAKLLLFIGALIVLTVAWARHQSGAMPAQRWTPWALLAALGAMALSMIWGEASQADALGAWAKHGKLLTILLILVMIRSREEARTALLWWGAGQVTLMIGTLALALGLPLPWQTSHEPQYHAVFSSYLDQSIMAAVLAAVAWHLRGHLPERGKRFIAPVVCGLAFITVFVVFPGRTGHLVGVILIALAAGWALPRKSRSGGLVLVLAALLALGLAGFSDKVRQRAMQAVQEVQNFSASGNVHTSSGTRLNLWRRSAQAIAEKPLLGHGVGSWNQVYERVERKWATSTPLTWKGNPHQEFLLWGVELGVVGMVVLVLLLGSLYQDARAMEAASQHALLSVLTALVVASMFNSVLFDALIGDFFCTVIGLLLALGQSPSAQRPAS